MHGFTFFGVLIEVFVGFFACIDTCLGAFNGQRDGVHHVHCVAQRVTLHDAHDFDVTSGSCMHNHFYERNGRDTNLLEVFWICFPRLFGELFLQLILIKVVNLLLFYTIFEFKSLLCNLRLRNLLCSCLHY